MRAGNVPAMSDARIELTFRLWSTGADERFEEYLTALTALLPRHRGELVRRVAPVEAGAGDPDALLVMSFPDRVSIDGFLRDPARNDLEELAGQGISRSLITDGRTRAEPDEPASLHQLHPDEAPDA